MQIIVRPVHYNEQFHIYVQYDVRPNLTHYDFVDSVPKSDLTHLSHLKSLKALNPEVKEELLYTVAIPGHLTASNGTYWIGVKLKRRFFEIILPTPKVILNHHINVKKTCNFV